MRFRSLLMLALIAGFATPLGAAPPQDLAKILWNKSYPKVIPSATKEGQSEVELVGTYTIKPGWSIKGAEFTYAPRAGGSRSQPTKVDYLDGKWGTRDPKNKSKIIPLKVPIKKGEWGCMVIFTLEGTDPATGKLTTVQWAPAPKSFTVK